MQAHSLVNLISHVLTLYRGVHVPGIGSFRIESSNPIGTEQEDTIDGPYVITRFYNDRNDTDIDLLTAALISGIIEEKEISAYSDIIENHINDLLNLDKTTIPNLGILEKNENNETFLSHSYSELFQPIRIMPSVTLDVIEDLKVAITSDAPHSPFMTEETKAAVVETAPRTTFVVPQEGVTPAIRHYQEEEKPFYTSMIFRMLVGALMLALAIFFTRSCWGKKTAVIEEPAETTSLATEDTEQDVVIADPNLLNKYAPFITPELVQDGCEIVIGSFNNRSNAISRQQYARSLGYDVLLTPRGSGFRIAIVFDCANVDMLTFYDEVAQRFGRDVWFLTPQGFNPREWRAKQK